LNEAVKAQSELSFIVTLAFMAGSLFFFKVVVKKILKSKRSKQIKQN
jgi:hypothetical protein